jgi:hypothetical protein
MPLPARAARRVLTVGALLAVPRADALAQAADAAPGARWWSAGASAIGVVTRATPALFGRDLTEGYVTQPVLMAHARPWAGVLALRATLDFEGLTLRRGELTPGAWGEGYVDRRHPHTYAHELLAELTGSAGPVRASLSAGKGFAPFGTDDPMVRPIVKYPVNHHLAQILERGVVIGAVRAGPLTAEVGAFDGGEPTSPTSWPRLSRVGDSWSGRLTMRLPRGLELQGSGAWVASPELAQGGGTDQRKWSASARYSRGAPHEAHRYAMVEWAATDEVASGARARRLPSVLGEAAASAGPWEVGARLERTTRPEEERLRDPFRSVRPATDASVIGFTRWTIGALDVSRRAGSAFGVRAAPFVEVTRSHAAELRRPSGFEPAAFYGNAAQWGVSLGVRLDAGMRHARMGRYGVADDSRDEHATHDMHATHDTH